MVFDNPSQRIKDQMAAFMGTILVTAAQHTQAVVLIVVAIVGILLLQVTYLG
jgi:hypothetical protein